MLALAVQPLLTSECDNKNASYYTKTAHHVAHRCLGHNVTVSDGRHGDERPPDCVWYGIEVVFLDEVYEAGEYHDSTQQKDDHQQQLFCAHLRIRHLVYKTTVQE